MCIRDSVCIVLARAPYFWFREDGTDTIVENPAAKANSGAGIQAAQFLVDNHVNVLITVRCGQNAADVFKAADMKIYKSANKAAADDMSAMEEDVYKRQPQKVKVSMNWSAMQFTLQNIRNIPWTQIFAEKRRESTEASMP